MKFILFFPFKYHKRLQTYPSTPPFAWLPWISRYSEGAAAHASLESKRSRGFPLIIISIINKSVRWCSKSPGDGPCTIPRISLIQHAVRNAEKTAGRKESGEGGKIVRSWCAMAVGTEGHHWLKRQLGIQGWARKVVLVGGTSSQQRKPTEREVDCKSPCSDVYRIC